MGFLEGKRGKGIAFEKQIKKIYSNNNTHVKNNIKVIVQVNHSLILLQVMIYRSPVKKFGPEEAACPSIGE